MTVSRRMRLRPLIVTLAALSVVAAGWGIAALIDVPLSPEQAVSRGEAHDAIEAVAQGTDISEQQGGDLLRAHVKLPGARVDLALYLTDEVPGRGIPDRFTRRGWHSESLANTVLAFRAKGPDGEAFVERLREELEDAAPRGVSEEERERD